MLKKTACMISIIILAFFTNTLTVTAVDGSTISFDITSGDILTRSPGAVIIKLFILVLLVFFNIQLLFCLKTGRIAVKLIPVYMIISGGILAAFFNFYTVHIGILPAVIGAGIAWAVYGIYKSKRPIRQTIRDLSVRAAMDLPERAAGVMIWPVKNIQVLFPAGMIHVLCYVLYIYAERWFLAGYFIDSDPYKLIRVCSFLSWLSLIIFAAAMLIYAFRKHHPLVFSGYSILLIMAIISLSAYADTSSVGRFGLGPPGRSIQTLGVNNEIIDIMIPSGTTGIGPVGMSIMTPGGNTEIVLIMTIVLLWLLAAGYLKKDRIILLSLISFAAAVSMTLFGITYFSDLAHGFAQFSSAGHFILFTQMVYVFLLSYMYTFRRGESKE